jgi:hypothetical protein
MVAIVLTIKMVRPTRTGFTSSGTQISAGSELSQSSEVEGSKDSEGVFQQACKDLTRLPQ